jgi:hypothetical protein
MRIAERGNVLEDAIEGSKNNTGYEDSVATADSTN